METLGDISASKTSKNEQTVFYCENCDYKCCRKFNWDRHILTSKHLKEKNGDKCLSKTSQNEQLVCEICNKEYKHRQGLWRHKKKCYSNETKENNEPSDKQLIMLLIKQNTQLMEQNTGLMEIVKNGTHNTTNNNTTTHTNSHNKAFNLNFFLNETCKNAMNITDFVDSIKLQLSDFMEVGEIGYIQGISNIIIKKLNSLDETIRPIHCTDQKRETFYVKDENKWEKEEEDMKQIRKMIKKVAYKNERLMTSYKEKYPDYIDPDSRRSDQYSKFVIEALGGNGENYKEKENKIINHISRATTIKNKINKSL
jgi:hypothetical protein